MKGTLADTFYLQAKNFAAKLDHEKCGEVSKHVFHSAKAIASCMS